MKRFFEDNFIGVLRLFNYIILYVQNTLLLTFLNDANSFSYILQNSDKTVSKILFFVYFIISVISDIQRRPRP